MRKLWIATTLGLAFAVGMVTMGLVSKAMANQVVIEPGWRYNDGTWNYWDPDDRSWYYTDGRNWYTYGDNAWRVYNFDRGFGRKSFYREGYVVPKPGPDLVVPRHKVYVPR
jgi:hypothetical protein